jgi:hypothetical protein
VDFLAPGSGGAVSLIECRAERTVKPSDAAPMQRLIAPGVRALAWRRFVATLGARVARPAGRRH